MIKITKIKNWRQKIIILLTILALIIFLYIFLAPVYPLIKYKIIIEPQIKEKNYKQIDIAKKEALRFIAHLPPSASLMPVNRLIIPKIGINAPIIESTNAQQGLNQGVWHLPNTANPTKKGNMVVTGHRFKYLPPNNTTFYLFDKLTLGDKIAIVWQKKIYYYEIKKIKIVPKDDQSILRPTSQPVLTLFTCHPLYSQKQRLVVIAKPLNNN